MHLFTPGAHFFVTKELGYENEKKDITSLLV
jgi:hypothetical protein